MTINTNFQNSDLTIAENNTHATPPSGTVRLYAKTDGFLYSKDDVGAETQLGGGGVSEPANQIVYGTGTGVDSSSLLTFEPTGGPIDPGEAVIYIGAEDVSATISGVDATTTGSYGASLYVLGGTGLGIGYGGNVIVRGGTSSSGLGGNAELRGGDVGTEGVGGNISVVAGLSASATDQPGGQVTIASGYGVGDGAGGTIQITSGQSPGNGNGGQITITSGDSLGTGNGGDVALTGGVGGTVGANVSITAGNGGDFGGDVTITAGGGANAASDGGDVIINAGAGDTGGGFNVTAGTGNAAIGGEITLTGGAGVGSPGGGDIVLQPGDGAGVGDESGDVQLGRGDTAAGVAGGMIRIPAVLTGPPTVAPHTASGFRTMVVEDVGGTLKLWIYRETGTVQWVSVTLT